MYHDSTGLIQSVWWIAYCERSEMTKLRCVVPSRLNTCLLLEEVGELLHVKKQTQQGVVTDLDFRW